MRAIAALLCALLVLVAAPRVSAQAKPAPTAAPAPALIEVAPDSPRASLKHYLELCRAGEYADAAVYLDLPAERKAEGPRLARHLKAVLDRQIWVKLDDISPRSLGNENDRLPAGVEEIGTVPGPGGPEGVRLVRRRNAEGSRWFFSRATVDRIDDWYSRLRDHWLHEYLPERLLRAGPQDLLWWQWIALPVLFGLAVGAGNVLGYFTRLGLARLVARTKTRWDDALLARLGGPFTFAWALLAVELALQIALYPPAEAFVQRLLRAGFFLALFWFASRSIDIAGVRVLDLPNAKENPAARSLVPLGARALKVALVAIAAITALSTLGYPVASLVAGLGIGGVALALAAQKTVENLFGSLSIGVDQPFRVGDLVNVDTVLGVVESIGLRSTRIRTLDRTLVTIPNGKLADMRIESLTERDRIRLAAVLSLSRASTTAQIREVLEAARALLRAHPKIWPDPSVTLMKLGESSLDIEVMAWFQTTSWDEFVLIREEVLLELLAIVERAGTSIAHPTRMIHVAAAPGEIRSSAE